MGAWLCWHQHLSPIEHWDNFMSTLVLLQPTPEFILTTCFSGNTVGPASSERNESLWPYFTSLANLAEQVESILSLNK